MKRLPRGVLTVALLYLLKVIRTTGFLKGLYTDAELKSDNVKVGLRGAPPHLLDGFFYKLGTVMCVICKLIMVGIQGGLLRGFLRGLLYLLFHFAFPLSAMAFVLILVTEKRAWW